MTCSPPMLENSSRPSWRSSATLSNPILPWNKPVNVVVTTGGTSANLLTAVGFPPVNAPHTVWWSAAGLPGLALLGIWVAWRKQPVRLLRGLAFACLFLMACVLSSCGGSGGNNGTGGTPVGRYNLTVTGAFSSGSTTLTYATKLTLVVK
jgi:hypothetical protein